MKPRYPSQSGFTMVEIAISLGVIAFALVAIIGILPYAMKVQKENREETIINQDARMLLSAIQSGSRGMDDLTNYVVAITNYCTDYDDSFKPGRAPQVFGYTRTNSNINPRFPINTGARIVGLLSTPKYIPLPSRKIPYAFRSNYLVAYVRALSGTANEKAPQTNAAIQELGFNYRVVIDNVPYASYDPIGMTNNYTLSPTNSLAFAASVNDILIDRALRANVHDLRLLYRWPLLPNGNVGGGRQVFRTMVGGPLLETEEPDVRFPTISPAKLPYTLYYFQPNTFTNVFVTSP